YFKKNYSTMGIFDKEKKSKVFTKKTNIVCPPCNDCDPCADLRNDPTPPTNCAWNLEWVLQQDASPRNNGIVTFPTVALAVVSLGTFAQDDVLTLALSIDAIISANPAGITVASISPSGDISASVDNTPITNVVGDPVDTLGDVTLDTTQVGDFTASFTV